MNKMLNGFDTIKTKMGYAQVVNILCWRIYYLVVLIIVLQIIDYVFPVSCFYGLVGSLLNR